jgi:CheY-like chemotaxis protein
MAKKYKLLFAEDAPVWHEKIEEMAQEYPSVKFIHVSTGEEVLEKIGQGISILITDDSFILAGGCMTGLQVTKKVRDKEKKKGKIYIAIYSDNDNISKKDAIKAGANIMVQKGDNLLKYAINKALESMKN